MAPTASAAAKSPFDSKSAALRHFRDVIEPELRGDIAPMPEIALAELVELYLERHAATVRPRTVATLRERLRHAVTAYGDVPLRDLQRMSGDLAGWRGRQPERGPLRADGRPEAGARRGLPVGVHRDESCEAGWPEPPAGPAHGARLHERRA
jgi:hypothetical protein